MNPWDEITPVNPMLNLNFNPEVAKALRAAALLRSAADIQQLTSALGPAQPGLLDTIRAANLGPERGNYRRPDLGILDTPTPAPIGMEDMTNLLAGLQETKLPQINIDTSRPATNYSAGDSSSVNPWSAPSSTNRMMADAPGTGVMDLIRQGLAAQESAAQPELAGGLINARQFAKQPTPAEAADVFAGLYNPPPQTVWSFLAGGGDKPPRFPTSDDNWRITNLLAALGNAPLDFADYTADYTINPAARFVRDLFRSESVVRAEQEAEMAAQAPPPRDASAPTYRMPGGAQVGPGGSVTIPLTPGATETAAPTPGVVSGPTPGSQPVSGKDQSRMRMTPGVRGSDTDAFWIPELQEQAAAVEEGSVRRVQLVPVDEEGTAQTPAPTVRARPTEFQVGETFLDLTDDTWKTVESEDNIRRATVEEVDRVVAANPEIDPARAQQLADSGRQVTPSRSPLIEPGADSSRPLVRDRDGMTVEVVPDTERVDEDGNPIPETEFAFEDDPIEVGPQGQPRPPRAEAYQAEPPPEQQGVDLPDAPVFPNPPDREVAQMDEEMYKRRQFQLMVGDALAAAAAVPNEYGNVGQMIMALGGGLASGTARGLGERIAGRERFDANRIETEYLNAVNDYEAETGNMLRAFEVESEEARSATDAANTNALNQYNTENQNRQARFQAAVANRQRAFEILKNDWETKQPKLLRASDDNLVFSITDPETGVASLKIIPIAQQAETALQLADQYRKAGAEEEAARFASYSYAQRTGDPVAYHVLMAEEAIKNGYAPQIFGDQYLEVVEEVTQQITGTHPNLAGSKDAQDLIDRNLALRYGLALMQNPELIEELMNYGNYGARQMEEIPGAAPPAAKGDRR